MFWRENRSYICSNWPARKATKSTRLSRKKKQASGTWVGELGSEARETFQAVGSTVEVIKKRKGRRESEIWERKKKGDTWKHSWIANTETSHVFSLPTNEPEIMYFINLFVYCHSPVSPKQRCLPQVRRVKWNPGGKLVILPHTISYPN